MRSKGRLASVSFSVICLILVSLGRAWADGTGATIPRTTGATRSPAGWAAQAKPAGAAGTRDIGEALKVTGQTRNLSMDLLLRGDKDKLSFGAARTDYKDKVSSKSTNY